MRGNVLLFLALFAIVVPPVLAFFAVIPVGVAVAASAGVTMFTVYAGAVMEQGATRGR